MSGIIGIDLGTSNSAAAILEAGKPKIIPSEEGSTLYGKAFPSVVAFDDSGAILVGEPARRQAVSNPKRTITATKRKMGTTHKYKVGDKSYTPQQISAFLLQKIKRDAEKFLGKNVEQAVITVPAYFNDDQRQATKDAGTIAGLDVVRIVNEPTSASLAYGLDKSDKELTIMVFDFGGGTLDVTIMEFGEGVFEVRSTSGDTQLGGTDMDNVLVDFLTEEFKKQEGIDITSDATAMQRLREAGERAKIELSTTLTTQINLPFLTQKDDEPKHFTYEIKRSQLEQLISPIVERCRKPMEQAVKDAGLSVNDIHKVILVGGPTRMPIVQKFVEDYAGKKIERGVDPMECVAMGAAIQAGILGGEIKDVLLLDVTPLSLGIETLGGVFTKLIDRNTTVPMKNNQIFSTASDNQPAVSIHVLQGERAMAGDNKTLGRFDLIGIPPAPRGIPQIDVTFDIDANGIINVSAKDLGTGKEQAIRITAANKLKQEDIERMKQEAEKHAKEDEERRKEIETVNKADTLVYSTDKLLDEMKDKVDSGKLSDIKTETDKLRELLKPKEKDIAEIDKQMEALNKKVQEASTELYQKVAEEQARQQQASASAAGSQESAEEKKEKEDKENVVEAEFREEKTEKKEKKGKDKKGKKKKK